jgi:hypothetical protein
LEQDLAPRRIVPAFDEIRENPAWSFDSVEAVHRKPSGSNLPSQVLRAVKVCGRKIVESIGWVLMVAVRQVALHDASELLVLQ